MQVETDRANLTTIADGGERRRARRIKVAQPVRLRPAHASDGKFDEVETTLNASREGLYFRTHRTIFQTGMSLRVTFPYCSVDSINFDYLGEVVRVDTLPNGCFGVAIRLVKPCNS